MLPIIFSTNRSSSYYLQFIWFSLKCDLYDNIVLLKHERKGHALTTVSIALKTFSEKSKISHFDLKMGEATQYILMWNVPFVKHNRKKTPFSDRLSGLYALLYTKKLDMPESYNKCNLLFFLLVLFSSKF